MSVYYPQTPQEEILNELENFFKKERRGDTHARSHAKDYIQKKLVQTNDGSYTLPSQKVGEKIENMHSLYGALTESRLKFVTPGLKYFDEPLKILDLCSGLGYNTAAVLEAIKTQKVQVDMVEFSTTTLAASLLIPSPLPEHLYVKSFVEEKLLQLGYLSFREYHHPLPSNLALNLYIDDARKVVQTIDGDYHVIFLDAFSPQLSPELYTVHFFKSLTKLLHPQGLILTYTSAAPVRSAMIEAGLDLGEGPAVGRSGGTVASLSIDKIETPLSRDAERMISLSDVGIPYQDPQLRDSSSQITMRRKNLRKESRGITRFPSTVRSPIYLLNKPGDPALQRRVDKQLKKMGISSSDSDEARFLVCPQYSTCICGCGQGRFKGSRDRIIEMQQRLILRNKQYQKQIIR